MAGVERRGWLSRWSGATIEVRSGDGLAQFSEEEDVEEIQSLKKMNNRREKKNCAPRAVAAHTNKGCPDKGGCEKDRMLSFCL